MSEREPGKPSPKEELRQLLHEMGSDLTVIAMGLEALEGVRHDPIRFAEIMAMIRSSGVEPVKQKIATIGELTVGDPRNGS
jgi:hypothetical protein